jgi:hypothetical protein
MVLHSRQGTLVQREGFVQLASSLRQTLWLSFYRATIDKEKSYITLTTKGLQKSGQQGPGQIPNLQITSRCWPTPASGSYLPQRAGVDFIKYFIFIKDATTK